MSSITSVEPLNLRTVAPFIFILAFSLFLFSLHPTITVGDSGEIVAAGFSLGMAHPPGYPLFVLTSAPFTMIPFGNIAFRVNLAAAVFGAISCLMVCLITQKIAKVGLAPAKEGKPQGLPLHLPAFFASGSLALSYQFWYRSTCAEVYTLNVFLILIMIYILLVWREHAYQESGVRSLTSHASPYLYLVSFLLGLGIGNHHTIILLIPGAILFVLWSGVMGHGSEGAVLRLTSHVSRLTFFFLLGLSIYLYLPIRSAQNPFMDWGDPQAISNFIDVFTRRAYLPEEVGRNWGTFVGQLKTFNPVHEFTIIGSLFGLLGVWGIWKWDKSAGAMILLILVLTSYGLIFLAGPSATDLLGKFYLPAYSIFSILIGVGVATILKPGVSSTSQPLDSSRSVLLSTSHISRLTFLLAAISLIWQFSAHYPRTQNSGNYLTYDYGMNELNSLREGTTYIGKGEVKTFPLWYLQGVESYREDVKVITAYFWSQRWYLKEALKLAGAIHNGTGSYNQIMVDAIYRANSKKGVYSGFIDQDYLPDGMLTSMQGITFQLYKDHMNGIDTDVWPLYELRGIKRIEDGMDKGVIDILKDYASSRYNTGIEYYEKGDKQKALTEFEKALAINPDDPDILNNLAVLYAEKGIKLKEAEGMAKRAFELYTGEKDREMVMETLEGIKKK